MFFGIIIFSWLILSCFGTFISTFTYNIIAVIFNSSLTIFKTFLLTILHQTFLYFFKAFKCLSLLKYEVSIIFFICRITTNIRYFVICIQIFIKKIVQRLFIRTIVKFNKE